MNKLQLSKTSKGYYASLYSYDDHKGCMNSEAYLTISSTNHQIVGTVLKTLGYVDYIPSEEEFVRTT